MLKTAFKANISVQSNLSLQTPQSIIETPLYYGQFVWSQKCQKWYIPYPRLCSKENFREPFVLSRRPDLKVGRPNKNFGKPFGLPTIPAGVPTPLKLVAWVHLMRKYFVRARILLACCSPNSVILAYGFDKNPHVVSWNPSKFLCHSDLKPETWAMPPNCLGYKEGKVKKFSGLSELH